jgi:hypothetical protein
LFNRAIIWGYRATGGSNTGMLNRPSFFNSFGLCIIVLPMGENLIWLLLQLTDQNL